MENHKTHNGQVDRTVDAACASSAYEPPKLEKMQKLAEVTGEMKMTGGEMEEV